MNRSLRILSTLVTCCLAISLSAQEIGKASYYANEFDGGRTYFGETYDKDQYTAAHKVHPQGTRLKVTRIDNGKSVIVRVNDRGPYISGRIIELSYAAARDIGMLDEGVADVQVEVVSKGANTQPATNNQQSANNANERGVRSRSGTTSDQNTQSDPPATRARGGSTNSTPPVQQPATQGNSASPPSATTPATQSNQAAAIEDRPESERILRGYEPYGLFDIKVMSVQKAGFGVQVATFSSYENTLKKVTELQGMWFNDILVSVEKVGGNKRYKVILGPFADRDKASNYLSSLRKNKKGVDGFVVDLNAINYE